MSIQDPPELCLKKFDSFQGEVILPGSKSVANRVLLCSSLSHEKTRIENLPEADDIKVMIRALKELGVELFYKREGKGLVCEIQGCGGNFSVQNANLNLENAGTVLRPLTAVLCTGKGIFSIDGDEQMRKRPIGDLLTSLRSLGANIKCQSEGYPPFKIQSNGLSGGRIKLKADISSQYLSSLLLAAPLMKEDLCIDIIGRPVSLPYIDLTIHIMEQFGIHVNRKGYQEFQISSGQSYSSPSTSKVEGDATAATYFLAAGSLPGCGPVRVIGAGKNSLQGDLAFVKILERMGAQIQIGANWIEVQSKDSSDKTSLQAVDVNMNSMPDAAMTLAVLALFAQGTTHIRDIANLRLKESERIEGLRKELTKLGAQVQETRDSLHITPPSPHQRTSYTNELPLIETYRDHRMAMAFSLAAYQNDLRIKNPNCVKKTYPSYFQDFLALCC